MLWLSLARVTKLSSHNISKAWKRLLSSFLPGLYQSQELPVQHQREGDERGGGVGDVQALVQVLER